MKFLLPLTLFLLTSIIINGQTIERSIELLPKNYRGKSSFSCELESKNSFHIILAKSKNRGKSKKFAIFPVRTDEENLQLLRPVEYDLMPSIMSYHTNGDLVSFVLSEGKDLEGNKLFSVLDINAITGKFEKSETFREPYYKSIVKSKHNSLILFCSGNDITIKNIITANNVKEIWVTPSKDSESFFIDMEKYGVSVVNTNEYVKNGSINQVKAYHTEEDELVITNDNLSEGFSSILKLPLNKSDDLEEVSHLTCKSNLVENKKLASFYRDQLFYQLAFNNEKMSFQTYDTQSHELKAYDLYNAPINIKSLNFENVETFFKKAKLNTNIPTISVNKTKDNNNLVIIDFVLKEKYNYYNMFWFHNWMFNNMILDQQQFFLNATPKFGPSPIVDSPLFYSNTTDFFSILLDDKSKEIINKSVETVYSSVDKRVYISKLQKYRKNMALKSNVFINERMHYFFFDKDEKIYKLYEANIHAND